MNAIVISTLLVLFLLVVLFVEETASEKLPEWMSVSGPVILIHSTYGLNVIEEIATYKQFWKKVGTFGIVTLFVGMIASLFGIGTSAASVLFRPSQTRVTEPKNYLAIPGVNDFLPMSVALEILLALAVGVIVHEAAHAVLCRVEEIEIDSTGIVFLSFLPMGAFVEPVEESKKAATRIGRMRMASAGILGNLALTIISMIFVIILISLFVVPTSGAAVGGVYQDSPAEKAALQSGSVIVSINGKTISSNEDLNQYLSESSEKTLSVRTATGREHTITRSVFAIESTTPIPVGETIQSVNGVTINTKPELISTLEKHEIAVFNTNNKTYSIPAGAKAKIKTGETTDEIVYITAIEGERILYGEEVTSSLTNTPKTVTYYTQAPDSKNGFEKQTATITQDDVLTVYDGIAGMKFSDTGIKTYPSDGFLSILSFNTDNLLLTVFVWFVLPLGSIIPGLEFSFPGFTPENTAYYTIPLASGTPIESFIFSVITFFFWSAWLNFNLALFNCLPIWALDGYHVIHNSTQKLAEESQNKALRGLMQILEHGIPLLALLLFIIILAAPVIVSALA